MPVLSPPKLQNGSAVPILIYGTTIHTPPHPQPDIIQSLQSGFFGIDTASSQKFHNEARDGDAIQTAFSQRIISRESLLVQTKYTSPYGQPTDQASWPYRVQDSHSLRVLKSFSRSVQDLKVGAIDVYFLHSPLESLDDTLEIWRTLEDVVLQGGVRYLGLCNVDAATLGDLSNEATIKPAFVQNPLRRRDAGYDVEVVRFCQQTGIVYQVFGLFWSRNQELFGCQLVRDLIQQGATMHQALIGSLTEAAREIGLQLCILSGTTSKSHMEENIAALNLDIKIEPASMAGFLELLGWDNI
ncbi:Maturation and nuclear export of 40S ribosomal subunits interacting protein [Fusarium torreyae]|uniref:Maturation and nuclear export of 40S ribosomal subunits interacting protein n=1 Tax=Fusarium torreyae TaxID=1237075 RepID=A0A9W8RTQ3_9HYPO|nr:Maturation and nuclear export of 40S ribosomal subunits interacting protein [Fusarium torreyae]